MKLKAENPDASGCQSQSCTDLPEITNACPAWKRIHSFVLALLMENETFAPFDLRLFRFGCIICHIFLWNAFTGKTFVVSARETHMVDSLPVVNPMLVQWQQSNTAEASCEDTFFLVFVLSRIRTAILSTTSMLFCRANYRKDVISLFLCEKNWGAQTQISWWTHHHFVLWSISWRQSG